MPNGLSPELEHLIERITEKISTSWNTALDMISRTVRKLRQHEQYSPTTAFTTVRSMLSNWPSQIVTEIDKLVTRLFGAGYIEGVTDTEVPLTSELASLHWVDRQKERLVPAFRKLVAHVLRRLGRVANSPIEEFLNAIDLQKAFGRNRIKLVINTETASATNNGRIAAWQNDPRKDWYLYHWEPIHDNRTKNVSLDFEKDGPYSFQQFKQLWDVKHQTPQRTRDRFTGKTVWEVSVFNCRCEVSRVPKSNRQLYNEGLISRFEVA